MVLFYSERKEKSDWRQVGIEDKQADVALENIRASIDEYNRVAL